MPRSWVILIVALAGVACGVATFVFGRSIGSGPESSRRGIVHDFGALYVEDARGPLEHEFRLTNSSVRDRIIVAVVATCGCLDVTINGERFDPKRPVSIAKRETVAIRIGTRLAAPGVRTDSATIIFDDNLKQTYAVRVQGLVRHEFRLILRSVEQKDGVVHAIARPYAMSNQGLNLRHAPEIVSPPGIAASFAGWTTLEVRSPTGKRPSRQVGNVNLDFSGYVGDFPVDVRMRLESGSEAGVTIRKPCDPSECG